MKTLYLDCGMGAAGDMLTAALLELLPEPKAFLQELNALGIPGVVTTAVRTEKCGICGTQLSVTVNGAEEESEDVRWRTHMHAVMFTSMTMSMNMPMNTLIPTPA